MQDAKALFGAGLERHLARDWPAAEAAYRQALALSPGRPSVLFNLGRLMLDLRRDGEAGDYFARVVAASPQDREALGGLGESLARQGRYADALASHARALSVAPEAPELQANFARCAMYARARPDEIDARRLEPALLACLAGDAIDPQALAFVASLVVRAKHATAWNSVDARSPGMRALMQDGLVHRCLEKIVVANVDDEAFFTTLRRSLLLSAAPAEMQAFLGALACQCFLNEYIWDVDDEEAAALRTLALAPASPAKFALLACYRRPVRADAEGCEIPPDLLRRLIQEPETEASLAAQLPRSDLVDAVSRDVGAMYEENPYPRWTGMFIEQPRSYAERILEEIAPHAPALGELTDRPRVLVAGGGTGRDPLAYARFCTGAQVRSIDLSRASLAHARRKADELGVHNLEFAQQDILALEEEGAYDVVSCLGVLHHLGDPEAGLRRLVRALKPGGFLMLALYSAAARRDVTQIRALIASEGYEPTPEGIRTCRQRLRRETDARIRGLTLGTADFYSMSMARDMLFHVQEHQFDLVQVEDMLQRHGLEFLGFRISDPAARTRYHARWPDDEAMADLGRWRQLEEENPTLFRAMYQFWTRKMRGP